MGDAPSCPPALLPDRISAQAATRLGQALWSCRTWLPWLGSDGSQAASRSVISGSLTLDSGRGHSIAGGVFCKAPDHHYFSAHSVTSFSEHQSITCFVRLWVQRDNNAAVTPDLQARPGLLASTAAPQDFPGKRLS